MALKSWKFKATKKLVDLLGKEWEGEYEVLMLKGIDYLAVGDECIDELKKKGKKVVLGSDIPQSMFNYKLFCKAVLHNGKPIEQPVPGKLLEMLTEPVMRRNRLCPDEEREIFLESMPALGDEETPASPRGQSGS